MALSTALSAICLPTPVQSPLLPSSNNVKSSCSFRTRSALLPPVARLQQRSAFCGAALGNAARSSRAQSRVVCSVPNITEANFQQEVLDAQLPVVVDFWANWCGPCKLVAPLMDWAAKEYDGKLKVVKIETDSNKALVEKYKVYGLPTIIIFDKGSVISHNEGAINKTKLQTLLLEKVPTLV